MLVSSNAVMFSNAQFFLNGFSVGTGTDGLGTAVAIGQQLVCLGGAVTSLPVGLGTIGGVGVRAFS